MFWDTTTVQDLASRPHEQDVSFLKWLYSDPCRNWNFAGKCLWNVVGPHHGGFTNFPLSFGSSQPLSMVGLLLITHCCTVDHCGGALRERNHLWLHLPFPAARIPFPKSVLVFSREGVSSGASLSGTYWISWSDVCNSSLSAKLPFLMVPTLSTWKELPFQGNSALECGCSY